MHYTVKKLAQLSGVSVRTLHYYDQIGLLKPAYVGEAGYRYYQEEQLLQLQQVLFFKELGFSLKQIQKILQQSDLELIKALRMQKELLQTKITRVQELLNTIDQTINHIEGKYMISSKEIFKGFEPDSEQQKKYEQFLEHYWLEKYGSQKTQEILAQQNKSVKTWSKNDWQKVQRQADDFCKEFVKLIENKFTPDSPEAQNAASKHYEWIKKFWTPTKESYAGHADFIMETDLKRFYDSYHPQLAQFIADAIKIFAERNL